MFPPMVRPSLVCAVCLCVPQVRAASTVTSWSNQTPTALPNVPPPLQVGTASDQKVYCPPTQPPTPLQHGYHLVQHIHTLSHRTTVANNPLCFFTLLFSIYWRISVETLYLSISFFKCGLIIYSSFINEIFLCSSIFLMFWLHLDLLNNCTSQICDFIDSKLLFCYCGMALVTSKFVFLQPQHLPFPLSHPPATTPPTRFDRLTATSVPRAVMHVLSNPPLI